MSNKRRESLTIAAGLAALLCGGGRIARAEDTPRRLTLVEAIGIAQKENPELALSAKSIEAAGRKLKSTKGLRLPSLTASSNVLFWNKAIEFQLPAVGYEIPAEAWPSTYPPTPPPIVPVELPPEMWGEPITVKGRVTSTTSLTLAQPITTLLIFNELVDVDRAGLKATKQEHATARLDIAHGVALAYLGVLQARAATKIAEASAGQVEAQLKRAKVLEAGAVLERVDVMRLEAALANTRHQVLGARSAVIRAERGLVHLIGLPAGTRLEPIDELADAPAPPPVTEEQAVEAALGKRPELRAARTRSAQAESGRRAAKLALLPHVLAVANLQHDEGGGVFAEKNSWFVGLTLEWHLWDFGHTWYAAKEAESRVEQARMAAVRLNDRLALEARNHALEARTAYDAIAVAKTGLEAAEEAFRIQSIRYAEGAATTTDLLDAETEVTRARLLYTTTRYAYFMAIANLARAIGDQPGPALAVSK